MSLYPRAATSRVTTGLGDTPVVMIIGPRQCGKTTLVRSLSTTCPPYLPSDDHTTLAAARTDPAGFVRDLDTVTIADIGIANVSTPLPMALLLSPLLLPTLLTLSYHTPQL